MFVFTFTLIHCKFLNETFEYNDIVIFIYSHYPLDLNAKSSDAKGNTFRIVVNSDREGYDCMYIKITMSLHSNLAFRYLQCI